MSELSSLRAYCGAAAKDMVAVVQRIYPKFDKTMLSKCEHEDDYGATLPRDAMDALYAAFAPDAAAKIAVKGRKADRHLKTGRLYARLDDDTYAELMRALEVDGYGTVQDWIAEMARRYLLARGGVKE